MRRAKKLNIFAAVIVTTLVFLHHMPERKEKLTLPNTLGGIILDGPAPDITLKTCPFCGGECVINKGHDYEIKTPVFQVECQNDGCLVNPKMMTFCNTEQGAIEAWNEQD